MGLNFPDKPDLPLSKPPLREVICQIKFPPLLTITQGMPAGFQEKIKADFPNFEITQNIGLDVSQPLPGEYIFASLNKKSHISLGVNGLAFSTQEYATWESFENTMKDAIGAFEKNYGLLIAGRVGLRYINELSFENTNTKSIGEILDFLNDDLKCLITTSGWDLPKKASHQLVLDDGDNQLSLRLIYEKELKNGLILDFDYFRVPVQPQETRLEEIIETLRNFHKNCYNAFRWSIREEKLDVFGKID